MKLNVTELTISLAMAVVSLAPPAAAQDVVVGWEGGESSGYAFVAPSARIPLSGSQAIVVRGTGSYLYYNSQADGPTDVMAPGVAGAIGYRFTRSRVSLSAFGGFERRYVDQHARSVRHALEGHLELIIMPVPVGVVALAEALAVFLVAQRRRMEAMGRGELELLTETNHGLLHLVARNG